MTARPGLRERKKNKTRRLLQQQALKLFVTQGYDNTTVEQICDAAEISPSTFFRYFPTKEDVVFADDYDAFVEESIAARDPAESIMDVIRGTLLGVLEQRIRQDHETTLARMKLASKVQVLRARMWQQQQRRVALAAAVLARRANRAEDDFEVRIVAAVLVAVIMETLLYWADHDGEPDIADLFTRALDRLGPLTL